MAGGALGLALIWKGGGQFIDQREQLPYLFFFLGALLTKLGSAYYHALRTRAPGVGPPADDARICRPGGRQRPWSAPNLLFGLRALFPLLALGAATVLYWYASERMGSGNIVPYAAYQGWSILVIVLLIAVFPGDDTAMAGFWCGRRSGTDSPRSLRVRSRRYRLLGGILSGHTIKHLLAAGAVLPFCASYGCAASLAAPKLAPLT